MRGVYEHDASRTPKATLPTARAAPRLAPRSERPWAGGGAGGRAAAALAGGPVPRGSDGRRLGSRGAPPVALARLKRADRGARDDEHARVRAGVAEPEAEVVDEGPLEPGLEHARPRPPVRARAREDLGRTRVAKFPTSQRLLARPVSTRFG